MKVTTDSECTSCGKRQRSFQPVRLEYYAVFTWLSGLTTGLSLIQLFHAVAHRRTSPSFFDRLLVLKLRLDPYSNILFMLMLLLLFFVSAIAFYKSARRATKRFVVYERGFAQSYLLFFGHCHLWADVSGVAVRTAQGARQYVFCFKDRSKQIMTIRGYRAEASFLKTLQQKAIEFVFEFHIVGPSPT